VTRKLVFVTQTIDPGHPFLAATVPKVHALARRFDEVVVLADSVVPGALPEHTRAATFAAGSRTARGRQYLSALNAELSSGPSAVLVHMVPLLAVLAAPLTRPRRAPLLLWFTHWKRSRTLVLAERAATAVVTVNDRSFPFESAKVVPIGHGIDLSRFPCARREPSEKLRVLALGRTSPAKGYETIVRAASLAGVDLELRGSSYTEEERAERARLQGMGARVEEPIPYADVPALLFGKDVLVNNMREGALDKVVYEAAATCMPVLASNSGFADLLPAELRFARESPEELAARLRQLAAADRAEIGRSLRAVVEERHSVDHWADEIARLARA
jgi:glycosyltransferase involved in cell wall biosynthesis